MLTAFTIESYQWLQDDPNDAIISLLSELVQTPGRTHSVPAPTGLPDAVTVRINAYWFLSLTLSLSAALVAILCKQWIREFERHGNQSHRQYISVRQTKLEGFEGWGVASTVTVIPLLLQSALGLFALGLIELLLKLHLTVAIVFLIPTTAAFVFYTLTTLLPALQYMCNPFGKGRFFSQCPFKSPQSLIAIRTLLPLWSHLISLIFPHAPWIQSCLSRATRETLESWKSLDRMFTDDRDYSFRRAYPDEDTSCTPSGLPPSCFRGLAWLSRHTNQPGAKRRIWMAVWDIITRFDRLSGINEFWSMHHGILELVPAMTWQLDPTRNMRHPYGGFGPRDLLADAILLAYKLDFAPAFKEELSIHHYSLINYRYLYYRALDEGGKHSLLHGILARNVSPATSSSVAPECSDFSGLDSYKLWPTMSREETCCIIALCFRTLHLCREGMSWREDGAKRQASSLLETTLSHACGGGSEEVRMALRALGPLVPGLRLDDGEFTAENDTVAGGRPAAPGLFEETIAQLARVYGDVRAREEQSSRASQRATAGPSNERTADVPRGDQADVPGTQVDDAPAHSAILSHSGTAALHADDAPDPVPHQSGQGTDNLVSAED